MGTAPRVCSSKLLTTISRMAGNAGSVSPSTIIITVPSANTRQYGTTWRSSRR